MSSMKSLALLTVWGVVGESGKLMDLLAVTLGSASRDCADWEGPADISLRSARGDTRLQLGWGEKEELSMEP